MNKKSIIAINVMAIAASLLIISCVKNNDDCAISRQAISFSINNDSVASLTKAAKTDVCRGEYIEMSCIKKSGEAKKLPKMFLQAEISDMDDSRYSERLTKGIILDKNLFLSNYKSIGFGVFGYQHPSAPYSAGDSDNVLKMGTASSGLKVTYNSANDIWSGNADVASWGGNKMSFFAYAPFSASTMGGVIAAEANDGAPQLAYTSPISVERQIDLLVAKKTDVAKPYGNIVSLNFTHPLTAIKFKIGPKFKEGKIISIALKNVACSGIYDMNAGQWIGTSNKKEFTLIVNKSYTASDASSQTLISGDDDIMFMIPQVFSDAASTIEIEYNSDELTGSAYTFSAPLSQCTLGGWKKGTQVTYKIAPDVESAIEPEFEVGEIPNITYHGINRAIIAIKSRLMGKQTGYVIKDKVPWSVEYSTDNGVSYSVEAPQWLSIAPYSNLNHAGLTVTNNDIPSQGIAWDMPKGTKEAPYNLSNQTKGDDRIENTANCYIVNGPGYYKIPLIYGNGIKDGLSNSQAYNGNNVHNNPFMNSDSVKITSPYIGVMQNRKVTGELLWQDEKNLVTNISVRGEGKAAFLAFQIQEASITQGNALLAIKDANNKILWSWHIWVTDCKLGAGDFTVNSDASFGGNGRFYTFMPVNLGWRHESDATIYSERKCKVKFIQQGTGLEVVKDVISSGWTMPGTYGSSSCYYQWGRKDPFPGCDDYSTKKSDITLYKDSGLLTGIKAEPGKFSIPSTIENPNAFHHGEASTGSTAVRILFDNWCYVDYCNLWNQQCTSDNDSTLLNVKTIFDPSPVGYCVPNSYSFVPATGHFWSYGYNWYGAFLPATGKRTGYYGYIQEIPYSCYYWSACPAYSDHQYRPGQMAYAFFSNNKSGKKNILSNRNEACAIRAMREQ